MDNGTVGPVPLRKSGIGASRDVPERGTGDNLEECVIHFFEVRFELALNVDNKRGCDRGKQSGLSPLFTQRFRRIRGNAYKDQRDIQIFIVFPDEITVTILSYALKLVVELGGGIAGRPEEAREEGRGRLEHGIL